MPNEHSLFSVKNKTASAAKKLQKKAAHPLLDAQTSSGFILSAMIGWTLSAIAGGCVVVCIIWWVKRGKNLVAAKRGEAIATEEEQFEEVEVEPEGGPYTPSCEAARMSGGTQAT